jgi:hypothetical protein
MMLEWLRSKTPFRRAEEKDASWQPWVLEDPRKKLDWSFWIGSPIAWLALVISGVHALYSLVYTSDVLSAVVAVPNPVETSIPNTVTFINSGNRPVVVLSAQLVFMQSHDGSNWPDCIHGEPQVFEYDFQEVVVKPNETEVRQLKAPAVKFELTNSNKEFARKYGFPNTATCISFRFVAGDPTPIRKTIMVEHSPGPLDREPNYLIRRSTFWTFVDGDSVSELKFWYRRVVEKPKPSDGD